MPATKVIVNIPGEEAYDVRIGGGVLANLGAHLRKLPVFASRTARSSSPTRTLRRCIAPTRRKRSRKPGSA